MNDFVAQIWIFMQGNFHRKELRFTGLSIVQEVFDAMQCRQTIENLIGSSQTSPFSVHEYGQTIIQCSEQKKLLLG